MEALQVGKIVEFLCDASGRGGHHSVTATITKVNPKTVLAVEANRSYRPGTHWQIDQSEIRNVRDPKPEHTCTFCNGSGKFTQGGVTFKSKCPMCVKGKVLHESFASVK